MWFKPDLEEVMTGRWSRGTDDGYGDMVYKKKYETDNEVIVATVTIGNGLCAATYHLWLDKDHHSEIPTNDRWVGGGGTNNLKGAKAECDRVVNKRKNKYAAK